MRYLWQLYLCVNTSFFHLNSVLLFRLHSSLTYECTKLNMYYLFTGNIRSILSQGKQSFITSSSIVTRWTFDPWNLCPRFGYCLLIVYFDLQNTIKKCHGSRRLGEMSRFNLLKLSHYLIWEIFTNCFGPVLFWRDQPPTHTSSQ
jgi:hypothetical protein